MRIIFDPTVDPPEADPTHRPAQVERQTGIRRLAGRSRWAAVVNGRLTGEYEGPGSKGRAIRAAGTNRVLA